MKEEIPYGYCRCGCGERTEIATYTCKRDGYVEGEPKQWINWHWRKTGPRWKEEDRGHATPCWVWQLSVRPDGYGQQYAGMTPTGRSRMQVAHRWVWEQHHGHIPDGLELDHLCRVRECVNPEHLEPVTPVTNKRRSNATKLTPEQVREIRHLHAAGRSMRSLGGQFGVDYTTARAAILRLTWAELT